MDGLGGELDVIAVGLTLAAEIDLVSTECGNFEKREALDPRGCGRVRDSYFCDLTRGKFT